MPTWHIKTGSTLEELSELSLRAKLRKGDLSGTELARREDGSAWAPLHEHPIFSEEVAFIGDPQVEAWRRQSIGFAWHCALFVGAVWFLNFPWWLIFWGAFVVGHLTQTVPALMGLLKHHRETPVPAPVSAAVPVSTDPFVARLETLLLELEASGEAVESIRRDAMALHERWSALGELLDGVDRQALSDELAKSQAVALAAVGSTGEESFGREVEAIQERLDILHESAAAQERIAARERELLHRLESVRLSIRRNRLEEDPSASATDQITEIQRRLTAEVEVNEQLARARRAASKQRQ
jgi:hypothetical protein